jgi:hypothetical protein
MSEALTRRVRQRFARDWGMQLPDSLVGFHEFLMSLGPAEQAAMREMAAEPSGVMDLFGDPDAAVRVGFDVRLHGRFYRDPPEFVTFLNGGDDALHYGLWFDDGRTCNGVGRYERTGIDVSAETPLQAFRGLLEQWAVSDGHDEDAGGFRDELDRLRVVVMRFETGDRQETGAEYGRAWPSPRPVRTGFRRIATLDGAGVLVPDYADGQTDRPEEGSVEAYTFRAALRQRLTSGSPTLPELVEEALRRCDDGHETDALALGRDLHWIVGDSAPTLALLTTAYRELDRPALAAIAELHHARRELPAVVAL